MIDEKFHPDVAAIKAVLLRVPVVAHSKASASHRQALNGNDKEMTKVWAQVVAELEAEGYASDPAGNPGPAVKAHYQGGVFTAGPVPYPSQSISTTDLTS